MNAELESNKIALANKAISAIARWRLDLNYNRKKAMQIFCVCLLYMLIVGVAFTRYSQQILQAQGAIGSGFSFLAIVLGRYMWLAYNANEHIDFWDAIEGHSTSCMNEGMLAEIHGMLTCKELSKIKTRSARERLSALGVRFGRALPGLSSKDDSNMEPVTAS